MTSIVDTPTGIVDVAVVSVPRVTTPPAVILTREQSPGMLRLLQ